MGIGSALEVLRDDALYKKFTLLVILYHVSCVAELRSCLQSGETDEFRSQLGEESSMTWLNLNF